MTYNNLPKLSEEGRERLDWLELLYQQIWTFAKFINEKPDLVETWKYADYVLYAMHQRFKEDHPSAFTISYENPSASESDHGSQESDS